MDGAGNVIVGGIATSTDFPHAGNVSSLNCTITSECFFLASISPDGSKLNYAGAVGGHAIPGSTGPSDGDDVVLAVDAVGNAYLSSDTWDPQFAITSGTLASSFAGYPYYSMFVLKVDNTGKLIYSTPVPGTASYDPTTDNAFTPWGMSVDSSGQVTIVGTAGQGLPTTPGVVSPQFPNATVNVSNPYAGFVLRINSTASAIMMASYLPGADVASGVATDSTGNLWITGSTTETTLPVSAYAYQKTPTASQYGSIQSGYIMELNSGATSVLKATYLDGASKATEEYSAFVRIALDSHSNVFVGGTTGPMDFPLVDPFMTQFETTSFYGDMVVAGMSPDLSTSIFGSFFSSVDLGIVRWGSDGLAFIGPSTDNTSAGLYLLRSSFVSDEGSGLLVKTDCRVLTKQQNRKGARCAGISRSRATLEAELPEYSPFSGGAGMKHRPGSRVHPSVLPTGQTIRRSFAVPFILGLGIGYLVGILIAPSAGSVTRARVKEKIDSKAREKAREIGARAGEVAYEELKHKV